MANAVIIHRGLTNTIPLVLGYDTTGDTISSQVRSGPDRSYPRLLNFEVTVVDESNGEYTLTIDDTFTSQIVVDTGYMDVLRITGGEPVPVFEEPLQVIFMGTVSKPGGAE